MCLSDTCVSSCARLRSALHEYTLLDEIYFQAGNMFCVCDISQETCPWCDSSCVSLLRCAHELYLEIKIACHPFSNGSISASQNNDSTDDVALSVWMCKCMQMLLLLLQAQRIVSYAQEHVDKLNIKLQALMKRKGELQRRYASCLSTFCNVEV